MYLGIDLGTASVKVVIVDDDGVVTASASTPLSVSTPYPLWSEQDPLQYWEALSRTMQTLKQQGALAQVHAIGVSGQMHGAIFLDGNGAPLRPTMLWNDGRSVKQAAALEGVPGICQITGNRVMPGFTAPKVLWVAENEPEVFSNTKHVLLPKDYLRFRMTGEFATDMSDASGTGWLDVAQRAWSPALIEASGLRLEQLPTLFEGNAVTGTLLAEVAREWGLAPGTPVVAGGGDNAASAVGCGIVNPGEAFLSLGTSGVYFVVDDRFRCNPMGGVHSMCHCLPGMWHHMTVHLSAAASLEWLRSVTGGASMKDLLAEAENEPPSSVFFLPYLSGERSPHNNPFAQGMFFGLTHQTRRGDLVNAVLEGVAFAFLDGQDALDEAGIAIDTVSVVGGGARSFYWGRILATILQKPLTYRQDREIGAAYGAALLAAGALHIAQPPIERTICPDDHLVEYYREKRRTFIELYRNTQQLAGKTYDQHALKDHLLSRRCAHSL